MGTSIYLYKFPNNTGNFEASPPCVAIETYFRFAGIDYEAITKRALAKSDSKTLPAIRVGGRKISDSENIIRYFEKETELGLDHFLSAEQETTKIMLWRLMNGCIYQFMVAERWLDPEVYPKFVETFKSMLLPTYLSYLCPLLKRAIAYRVRGKYLKSLDHLEKKDREVFMAENFRVLSDFLAGKRYLFGDKPSSADAFLFAYLYSFLAVPFENPTRTMISRDYPNLVTCYERILHEQK